MRMDDDFIPFVPMSTGSELKIEPIPNGISCCPMKEYHPECIADTCAWWDADRNQCAILTLAKAEAKRK